MHCAAFLPLLLSAAMAEPGAPAPSTVDAEAVRVRVMLGAREFDVELHDIGPRQSGSRRLRGRVVDPDLGSVTVRLAVDPMPPTPFDPDSPEGAIAAMASNGPYWVYCICHFTNGSAVSGQMGVVVTVPVSDPMVSLGGGSGKGFVVDGIPANGATFSPPASMPAVDFQIDGASIAGIWQSPFSTSAGPGQSAMISPEAWGTPIPSMPVPAPLVNIAGKVSPVVSGGDTVVLTFICVIY